MKTADTMGSRARLRAREQEGALWWPRLRGSDRRRWGSAGGRGRERGIREDGRRAEDGRSAAARCVAAGGMQGRVRPQAVAGADALGRTCTRCVWTPTVLT
jgi:hypothetical protein